MSNTTSTVNTAATPQPTQSSGGGSGSSPLLFFVALGFGILFTNLWIIVGVKYCLRARHRAREGLEEGTIDPLSGLMTIHGATIVPLGRRREKKLIPIEELDTRFPILTYKVWRSERESQGLSVDGGINASDTTTTAIIASNNETLQQQLIHANDGVELQDLTRKGGYSDTNTKYNEKSMSMAVHEEDKNNNGNTETPAKNQTDSSMEPLAAPEKALIKDDNGNTPPPPPTTTTTTTATTPPQQTGSITPASPILLANENKDKDMVSQQGLALRAITSNTSSVNLKDGLDTHVIGLVPDDLSSGNNCAICLDMMEDDDQVRGLPCGHAYHASCLDPWFSTRSASCPLCKADYYIPK